MRYGFSRSAALVALLVTGSFATADTTLLSEDFESYADTAALNAVWAGAGGTLMDGTYESIIDDTFEPVAVGANAFGESAGQAVDHIGGSILEYQLPLNGGSPLLPTESQSIVLQGDIFDVGAFGNKRMSIGLRSTAPANLVEIGHWNADPVEFAGRAILFAEPVLTDDQPNWQFYELPLSLDRDDDADEITTLGDIGEAWHTHRATITPTTITYEIDLLRDGLDARTGEAGFDAEFTVDVVATADGYNNLRIGSPSGVSTTGSGVYGGVLFDNISLSLVDIEVALNGDYNGDGFVDAADYTSWRDTLGDSVTAGEGADGNGNGVIDGPLSGVGNDYDVWSNNYGAGVAPGAAAAIPEPTTLLLVAMGLAAVTRRR